LTAPSRKLPHGERAVVLAGGKGERLAPYTTVLPKPLLPVGDRAILEVVVQQLRSHGFSELTFAVGYLDHLIRAVFDDGSNFDVSIEYHRESEPRGTAGPLATIDGIDDSFLVMNGDVLTTLDYRALFDTHRASGNAMTIASHRRVVETDYGVLRTSDSDAPTAEVVAYEEKPEIPYVVSIGVYILEPHVTKYVPVDSHFDMPDVVQALIDSGERVGSYMFDGFWLDIGRHEDYERAVLEYDQMAPLLLGDDFAATGADALARGVDSPTP
jgi:NDP-sugar pyrophosphorylase family protein